MARKRYPTYSVIVPASAKWLESKAREAHHELFPPGPDDNEIPYEWEIVAGPDEHSAVWGFDPAGDVAWNLAPLVSRQVKGKVHIAQLHERTYGSYAYEGGKGLGEIAEDPEKLARRLGVPFPEREPVNPGEERSVCVIEGVGPEAVARAVELTPEDLDVVKIDPHPFGAIVHSTDGSPVLGIGQMVKGPGLEGATTYALERSHGDVLRVWISRRGEIVLFFTTDDDVGMGPPGADRVWDIKGARDIPAILAALHVSPKLLGW